MGLRSIVAQLRIKKMSTTYCLYTLHGVLSLNYFQSARHSRDSKCEVICHKHLSKVWNDWKMCATYLSLTGPWNRLRKTLLDTAKLNCWNKTGNQVAFQASICVCVALPHVHWKKICGREALWHACHFQKLGLESICEMPTSHFYSRNIFSISTPQFLSKMSFSSATPCNNVWVQLAPVLCHEKFQNQNKLPSTTFLCFRSRCWYDFNINSY